jgi:hypothetical protein
MAGGVQESIEDILYTLSTFLKEDPVLTEEIAATEEI